MVRMALLLVLAAGSTLAHDQTVLTSMGPRVFVQPQDKVLAQLVAGGDWETVVVLLNMTAVPMQYKLNFYDESGLPLPLTFVTFPDNQTVTDVGSVGRLLPGGSFNFSLSKDGPLRVSWAVLTYDDTLGRLGGNAVLRQYNADNVPGAIFEAVVPFSNLNDYKFFMPYDNQNGFQTAMALVNTGTLTSQVSLTFLDNLGATQFVQTLTIPAGNHLAFSVPTQFPPSAGKFGTIYVQGSTSFLAGLGLRFNPAGPFTSVPILNWSGMFP